MAEKDRINPSTPTVVSGNPTRLSPRRSKLPTMPLATLLPPLGELARLHELAENVQSRTDSLQSLRGKYEGEDQDEQRKNLLAEESMLNQVILWLSLQSEEDG